MIDTCKFTFRMTKRMHRHLCDALLGNHPNIQIGKNRFFIQPIFGKSNIPVYFNCNKRTIQIESSLPKIIQGHNVFGSNHLEKMCLKVIHIIYLNLDLKYTPAEEKIILSNRIRLLRVDITCSFRMASNKMVSQLLEYIYQHFRAEGKSWSAYGRETVETVYSKQRSTRVTDKFYNKGLELLAPKHGIPADVPMRERIERMAAYLCRFEHTLRGKELVEVELNYADSWSVERVKGILRARINNFKFQGEIQSQLDVEALNCLNDSCRTFYLLWREGADLKQFRNYRTLDRARQTLKKTHKLDIYRPAGTGCPVPLREVFDPKRAYYSYPKSLVRHGAVFTGRE